MENICKHLKNPILFLPFDNSDAWSNNLCEGRIKCAFLEITKRLFTSILKALDQNLVTLFKFLDHIIKNLIVD